MFMFSQLPTPVLDPILSLTMAYRDDPRPEKVDLGIGVYKNSQGETPIMQAIQQAQTHIVATQRTKSYVGLAGCEEFNRCMIDLVLGASVSSERVGAVQTPGGSGALRMLADLIVVAQPNSQVWLTNPSYVNHKPVMEAAGLSVRYYRYFCPNTKQVDSQAMLEDLSQVGANDVVLMHGCCHNPTGADMDFATWQAVTELALKQGFTPFVDMAYQGLGQGLEADALGVRYLASRVPELLLTVSCSKNFGLYRERTGAALVIAKNAKELANAKGKMLTLARATYTMPPDHGAGLVKTILQDAQLTALWQHELNQMQQRVLNLRKSLCQTLRNQYNTAQFDFIEQHNGMFTMLGFSAQQMMRLRDEFAIYAVADGRINIAGLTENSIDYVAHAIAQVAS